MQSYNPACEHCNECIFTLEAREELADRTGRIERLEKMLAHGAVWNFFAGNRPKEIRKALDEETLRAAEAEAEIKPVETCPGPLNYVETTSGTLTEAIIQCALEPETHTLYQVTRPE